MVASVNNKSCICINFQINNHKISDGLTVLMKIFTLNISVKYYWLPNNTEDNYIARNRQLNLDLGTDLPHLRKEFNLILTPDEFRSHSTNNIQEVTKDYLLSSCEFCQKLPAKMA